MAVDDASTTTVGDPIIIKALVNDSDPDGDTLTIIDGTNGTFGTADVNADGDLVYTPFDPNFVGTDTFTYIVSDGNGGTDTATVTVTVEADPNGGGGKNMIMGTEGNDKWLSGTDGADHIIAKAGDDCIEASQGDDMIDGGAGYDLVSFASGSSSDYHFQANSDGTVTVTGATGTDLLMDIESIYFEETQEWYKIEDIVEY
ncbi:cadherin-like domain-containing protein [Ahrensia sp. AH-315-G08]|nr:cadherin-like domain-containing protein [Ahrensia sp. AH-315-G08]